MSLYLIAEAGSSHEGKWEYIEELLDRVAEAGFDAVKFQLFPNVEAFTQTGNVYLPPDLYLDACDYAKAIDLDCTASVFDEDSFDFLLKTRPPFIKFAYSKKEQRAWIEECLEENIEAIVSCDVMSDQKVSKGATKLFCVPRYPVYEQLCFDGIFPRFEGFSDHTLLYNQTIEAVMAGAKIIEKHITLPQSTCPDSCFALQPPEFTHMVQALRRLSP